MSDITEKTHELLRKCKDAGYERVAIFIRDKRIPKTTKMKDGGWFGLGTVKYPYKVVCGYPEKLGSHPDLPGEIWPKMWQILKDCGLLAGLFFGGAGLGDAHDIHPCFIEDLTAGYYDLLASIK